MMQFSKLTIQDKQGDDIAMQTFDGKVLLIVNTASKCGFTPQYEGLEALHQQYNEKGLAIIAFPCNQFGQQEPGDDASIQSFCSLNYNVTFPVMKKIEVNGYWHNSRLPRRRSLQRELKLTTLMNPLFTDFMFLH